MPIGPCKKTGCYDDLALGLQSGDVITKETKRCSVSSEGFCCCLESDWLRRVAFEMGAVPEAGWTTETSRIGPWKSPSWTLV